MEKENKQNDCAIDEQFPSLLQLPDEMIIRLIEEIEDSETFYNLSFTCPRLKTLCLSDSIQTKLIKKFSKIIISPSSLYSILPNGQKNGFSLLLNSDLLFGSVYQLCYYNFNNLEGNFVQFYYSKEKNNFNLKERSFYVNNQLNGPLESFHPNNQLELRHNLVRGISHGISDWYYENGQIRQKVSYFNGKYDGEYQVWSMNGILLQHSHFLHGKKEGLSKRWREEDGTLKFEGNYVQDKLDGDVKYWGADGALIEHSIFKSSVKHSYYSKGKIVYCKKNYLKLKKKKLMEKLPSFPSLSSIISRHNNNNIISLNNSNNNNLYLLNSNEIQVDNNNSNNNNNNIIIEVDDNYVDIIEYESDNDIEGYEEEEED